MENANDPKEWTPEEFDEAFANEGLGDVRVNVRKLTESPQDAKNRTVAIRFDTRAVRAPAGGEAPALSVVLTRGTRGLANRDVQFTVSHGELENDDGDVGQTLTVTTDDRGVAVLPAWTVGNEILQRVIAVFMDGDQRYEDRVLLETE